MAKEEEITNFWYDWMYPVIQNFQRPANLITLEKGHFTKLNTIFN